MATFFKEIALENEVRKMLAILFKIQYTASYIQSGAVITRSNITYIMQYSID